MKIPICLVTGFLGSGKTIFIDNVLNSVERKYRIGIVLFDFNG
jgi:G3E family GTPase